MRRIDSQTAATRKLILLWIIAAMGSALILKLFWELALS